MKTLLYIAFLSSLALSIVGCSGGGGDSQGADAGAAAVEETGTEATQQEAQDQVAAKVEQIEQSGYSEEDKELLTKWATYQTDHDPEAFYTQADLPDWGNYRKIDLTGLSDEAVNRIIHQLKKETCTCATCGPEWTLDRCLVVKPECSRGLVQTRAVIGRERLLTN